MGKKEIYDKVRQVPAEAKKPIAGGRLKGYTDINPQWRIEMLTDLFGPCGSGWRTEISERWTNEVGNEVVANIKLKLYVKDGEAWSEPIEGLGGSMLAQNEKAGLRANDEAWKMAETDAISVACKKLGFGASVYWERGETKYAMQGEKEAKTEEVKTEKEAEAKVNYQVKIQNFVKANDLNWEKVKKELRINNTTPAILLKKAYNALQQAENLEEFK